MISRKVERFGGVLIFTVSLILYLFNLYLISTKQYWYPKAMSIGAAFMVLGFAMIIFPSYRRERIERGENIDDLQGLSLLTPKWWGVLVVSIAAAIFNFVYFHFFFS